MSQTNESTPLSPRQPHFTRTGPATYRIEEPNALSGRGIDDVLMDKSPNPAFEASFVKRYQPYDLSRAITDYTTFTADSDAETLTPTMTRRSWAETIYLLVVDWWLWELFSWIISAFCLIFIAALLGYYNNKTLPSRWPGGVSLNTSIAVLSAIAKYAMSVPLDAILGQLKWRWFRTGQTRKLIDAERFDDATRGPWGAICLFWHLRGKHLASFGSIIVFLTLTMEPTFQQVVAYPQRYGGFGKSSLTKSVKYQTRSTTAMQRGLNFTYADQGMQLAVDSTVKGDGNSTSIKTFCPTANCKWPPFQTLGICKKCQDISSLLTFGCMLESGDWLSDRSTAMQGFNATWDLTPVTSCGYFLNATSSNRVMMSGYRVNTTVTPHEPGEILFARSLPLVVASLNQTWWDRTFFFKAEAQRLPLLDFMFVMNKNLASVYANATPIAAECVLEWCVKTIEASVEFGAYSEKVIAEWTNDTMIGIPKLYWDEESGDWEGTVQDIYLTPPGQNETFFVDKNTVFSTINPLRDNIPAFWTANNTQAQPLYRNVNLPSSDRNFTNSQIMKLDLKGWATIPNVSSYIEGIATAMTDVMRSDPNSSEPVMGYGGVETYVRIVWGWFCVPLLMLISCLIMLITTILTGPSREAGGVWKSSSLAVMLHGMSPAARDEFGDAWSLSEMRKKAKHTDIVMHSEATGMYFAVRQKGEKKG